MSIYSCFVDSFTRCMAYFYCGLLDIYRKNKCDKKVNIAGITNCKVNLQH